MINGRAKGHSWERKIAEDFRELGWQDSITTRQARGGDWSKTDNGKDLANTDPFYVQAKRGRGYAPISAIEEIQEDPELRYFEATSKGPRRLTHEFIPLLISKADHKKAMAVLPWDDLKDLIRMAYEP